MGLLVVLGLTAVTTWVGVALLVFTAGRLGLPQIRRAPPHRAADYGRPALRPA